jgi:glycosyltransferase involved in cell wall biosynthesis
LRIALVVHKFPPSSLGGTEIYTQNLARELSRQGHEVFVFYRDDEASGRRGKVTWEEREGFRACRVSKDMDSISASPLAEFLDTFFNPSIEEAFDRFLDEAQPDLVHFQHVMLLSYRLIAAAKRRGLPVLLTLHDYWFICANSQLVWPDAQICQGKALGLNCARCVLSARLQSPLARVLRPPVAVLLQVRDVLVRRAALKADQLIAPSRFLIREYVEAGWPADLFVHLENGIDVERIRRYSHHPSPDRRVRFTYLGSLAWQKGVHVLIEAFRGVSPDAARLRIYGDPTVFPEYAERIRSAANPANTSFEGAVPNEEVGRVLAETDVLVVPSLWYENSPVVIQEALAADVPVIASRVGALPEKINDEQRLFPVGDVGELQAIIHRVIEAGGVVEDSKDVQKPQSIGEATEKLVRLYTE